MTGRRLLAVMACFAVVAPAAIARRPEAKGKGSGPSGAFGWFGPGLSFVDYGVLNDKLTNNGFRERFDGSQWTFGGGGLLLAERVLVGGSGFSGQQSVAGDPEVGPRIIDIEYTGGQFDIGYALFVRRHLFVAPMLGIGATGYDMTLTYRSGDGEFRDLFGAGGRSAGLTYGQFSLTPQLMVAVPVSFAGIILRGGAAISPAPARWKFTDGGRVLDGPRMGKLTPFLGLNVMIGGVESGRRVKVTVNRTGGHEADEDDEDDEDEDE